MSIGYVLENGLLNSAGLSKFTMFYSSLKPKSSSSMPWGGSSRVEKSSSVHKSKIVDSHKFGGSKVFPEDYEQLHKRILDPGSEIVLKWNRDFIVSCLLALFIDPLYFYLPSIGRSKRCWCANMDHSLRIVGTIFRTIADLFYMVHVEIKFRTAYVAPSSRVFGRGELVMDPKKIARRYIRYDLFIDLMRHCLCQQVWIKGIKGEQWQKILRIWNHLRARLQKLTQKRNRINLVTVRHPL